MKKSSIIFAFLGLIIVIGIVYFARKPATTVAPINNSQPEQPIVISVNFKKGSVFEPQTYNVNEGQRVALKVISDVADEVHLHGYDLQIDLEAGTEGQIEFTANQSGRFEFELEKLVQTLGVIQVYPK